MTSKATNQRDLTDVIKKQKRDGKKAAGIIRAQASGISGADTAITSGQKTSAGGAGGSPVTQDLQMNTFDIRDVDRLYFSTTAGSTDVLTENDTGIESKSYYNGTSYVSVGMSQRVPANNVFTFAIGATEKFNIGTTDSALNSNLGLGGYLAIGDNYMEYGDTTTALVGTPNANKRRVFSDSANNDELSVKKSDGTVVSLESSGSSGANVTLSNLTDPTAINEDLNLLNNLITFDTDKDTNIYSSGDDNLQVTVGGNTKLQMSNTQILFAADVTFFSGYSNLILGANTITFTSSTQQITSLADGLKYIVPTGDSHEFTVAGTNQLTIGETAITMGDDLRMGDNHIDQIKTLTLNNYATSSSIDGTIYAADVSGVRHVYVRTAGTTKDLTDIGTASGGATTALDNLTTTNVNQSLIPSSTNSKSLGSSLKQWQNLFIDGIARIDSLGFGASYSMTLPTTLGTNGQVLTTNGSSALSWTTVSGGSSGASTTLNNLGTTAINASLIPASNLGVSLGSSSKKFNAGYIYQIPSLHLLTMDGTVGGNINMEGGILHFDDDNDTYIESSSDDQMQFFSGGSVRMKVNNSNVLFATDISMLSGSTINFANTGTPTGSGGYVTVKVGGVTKYIPYYS